MASRNHRASRATDPNYVARILVQRGSLILSDRRPLGTSRFRSVIRKHQHDGIIPRCTHSDIRRAHHCSSDVRSRSLDSRASFTQSCDSATITLGIEIPMYIRKVLGDHIIHSISRSVRGFREMSNALRNFGMLFWDRGSDCVA